MPKPTILFYNGHWTVERTRKNRYAITGWFYGIDTMVIELKTELDTIIYNKEAPTPIPIKILTPLYRDDLKVLRLIPDELLEVICSDVRKQDATK